MKTLLTRSPRKAAVLLQAGGVVAFPTETVYGLGAAAFDEKAIRAIFRAKGRPADNPLIAHIASLDQLPLLAARIPPLAQTLMDHFFPGPLTLILPRHPAVPLVATAGLDTIGIRMPALRVTQIFLRACGVPVVAPSANRSGHPSPTTWQAVHEDLDGRIDGILKGGAAEVGLESTVVDCTGRVPLVLRPGAVSLEQLRRVVAGTRIHRPRHGEAVRSPGLRHRHYAPQATVLLVGSPEQATPARDAAYIGLQPVRRPSRFGRVARCRDAADYARTVFHFFRTCDAAGIRAIYCGTVPELDIGAALMDRLRRAAAR